MESRKMVLMNLFVGQQWRCRCREQPYGQGGREEGDSEMNGEGSMKAYTLPCVKQIAIGNLLYRLRELKTGLYDSLEGWERMGDRREAHEGRDITTPMVNSS